MIWGLKVLKIGYFADGPWSHNAFERIIADPKISIQFICVRYDSEDKTLWNYAEKHSLKLYKHKNINSPDFLEIIKSHNCDLLVSMSFNQIFRKDVIELTAGGVINCHAGKLPYYRGRNILNWCLINDEKEFGITVHYVDEGIDTGDIILQETFPITDQDNYQTLLSVAYVQCARLLHESLQLICNKKQKRIPQSEINRLGFYCGRRMPGDEMVDWTQTSREVFNFTRAICKPGPMATAKLGSELVRFNQAIYFAEAYKYRGVPGQILAKTALGYLVKTLDSFIEIQNIETNAKIKVGDRFE